MIRFVLQLLPANLKERVAGTASEEASLPGAQVEGASIGGWRENLSPKWSALKLAVSSGILIWIFYATTAELIWMFVRAPLPAFPVTALEPFRIANQYGLFAVMTRGRYEIEFQGSQDGQSWVAYPFRYKPQDLNRPPGIYAPYQPRFDWHLWFASLGSWRDYPIVPNTEVRLLSNNKDVLALLPAILFRRTRRDRSVRCSGNTGSRAWQKNARPGHGGAGNGWACMRQRWSENLMGP